MIKKHLFKMTAIAAVMALSFSSVGCSKHNPAPKLPVSVEEYATTNPDVADIFGTSEEELTNHYATYGADEDVTEPTTEEATEYMESNPDLTDIFGESTEAATVMAGTYGADEDITEALEELTSMWEEFTQEEPTTEAATQESTTQAPTESVTEASTQSTTQASTEAVTQEPTTQAPTETPTQAPTQAPTQPATQEQTQAPTEAPVHSHIYMETVSKAATCEETGIMTYQCSCGDSYTTEIPALGHSLGGFSYNNDATTDADGTETAYCSRCGKSETRVAAGTKIVVVHSHAYSDTVTREASCETPGIITHQCACGDSYTTEIPALGHSYGEFAYNNDATTEADGTESASCSRCGRIETRTAAGTKIIDYHARAVELYEQTLRDFCTRGRHDQHYKREVKFGTCSAEGYDRDVCLECGAIISEVVNPTQALHCLDENHKCIWCNKQFNDDPNSGYYYATKNTVSSESELYYEEVVDKSAEGIAWREAALRAGEIQ